VPHLHLLVFGVSYRAFREWHIRTWVRCIESKHPNAEYVAGLGVEEVRSSDNVLAYVGKYCWGDKQYQEDGGDAWAGRRWWGVVGKPSLPWAEEVPVDAPDAVVVRLMRYGRARGNAYTAKWREALGWNRSKNPDVPPRPWWQSKSRKHVPGRAYKTLELELDPATWATLMAYEMKHAEGSRVPNVMADPAQWRRQLADDERAFRHPWP